MFDQFGDLRALLATPSKMSWHKIIKFVDKSLRQGDMTATRRIVDYISIHLESWDDELRVLPHRWVKYEHLKRMFHLNDDVALSYLHPQTFHNFKSIDTRISIAMKECVGSNMYWEDLRQEDKEQHDLIGKYGFVFQKLIRNAPTTWRTDIIFLILIGLLEPTYIRFYTSYITTLQVLVKMKTVKGLKIRADEMITVLKSYNFDQINFDLKKAKFDSHHSDNLSVQGIKTLFEFLSTQKNLEYINLRNVGCYEFNHYEGFENKEKAL
jgi:hypothetical protein